MKQYVLLSVLAVYGCQPESSSSEGAQPLAAAADCGDKNHPDCPLQGWMKSTMQPYQHDKEFERLAASFDKLAANAPQGYAHWKETATAGAAAARAHDETAVSKTCKSCHNEHRPRFRKERRNVPLF